MAGSDDVTVCDGFDTVSELAEAGALWEGTATGGTSDGGGGDGGGDDDGGDGDNGGGDVDGAAGVMGLGSSLGSASGLGVASCLITDDSGNLGGSNLGFLGRAGGLDTAPERSMVSNGLDSSTTGWLGVGGG